MKTSASTFFKLLILFGLVLAAVPASALDYPALKPKPEEEKSPMAERQAEVRTEQLLDKAVDENLYIVGPGDVFIIQFYGVSTEPLRVEVLPEGVVAIPQVGVVTLGQITLKEAKERIRAAVAGRVRDRSLDVHLAAVRSFKVSVTGAVAEPGVVVVSGADRVTEAIQKAGGLQVKASQRNIKLIKDSDTTRADIARFYATGAVAANPYLNEGHVVFVPVVSDTFDKIEVYGAVNAPGVFEYRHGDRISDLVELGFGLSADADRETAELIRFSPEGRGKNSIKVDLATILESPSSAGNLELAPDDRLFVRAIAGYRRKEQVVLAGEVKYPGVYPIQPGCETLLQLLQKAGGILDKASLSEAEMFRKPQFISTQKTSFEQLLQLSTDKLSEFELQYLKEISSEKTGKVAVDFEQLLSGGRSELDIPLVDGDFVRIPAKSFAVTVMGRVVNPGLVPYKEDATVDYYIKAAGGYGYKANRGDIRIIKANTGAVVKSESNTRVAMGDRIMVPQKKGINVWQFLKDTGFFLANIATIYIVVDQAVN